jgi:hypothetical protein
MGLLRAPRRTAWIGKTIIVRARIIASRAARHIFYVKKILGHKLIQNTLKYIDLETSLFEVKDDQFTVKVASNTQETCKLAEVGFEYVTGEYSDGGKIFRKRK